MSVHHQHERTASAFLLKFTFVPFHPHHSHHLVHLNTKQTPGFSVKSRLRPSQQTLHQTQKTIDYWWASSSKHLCVTLISQGLSYIPVQYIYIFVVRAPPRSCLQAFLCCPGPHWNKFPSLHMFECLSVCQRVRVSVCVCACVCMCVKFCVAKCSWRRHKWRRCGSIGTILIYICQLFKLIRVVC